MKQLTDQMEVMERKMIEISVKGGWIKVPAVEIGGKQIIARGKWIKVASIHDETWLETELENPEACIQQLKGQESHGLHADIFTFTQKVPGATPRYNYRTEWESLAVAATARFQDWWEKLPQETRKNVRRSQKRGVQVQVRAFDDELVRGIKEVNDDSPLRQQMRNQHYGKSIERTKKDYSAFLDRSDFICAFLGSEMIGFLKLVYRGEVASVLNLTTKPSHSDKRPANALVAKAVELCEAKGILCLTYGLFNYGNKRDSPLREFKIRNGFEEVLNPRFYIPLTTWGELCLKSNLHRGLLGILPHQVIALGLGARAKWHSFRQVMSRCSSMLERPNRTRQMERSTPPAGSISNPD
jgi:hypothetical protein